MRIGAAVTLVIGTVTITVAVQHFFKPAEQVDLQLDRLEDKITSSNERIISEMTIRREARDKEILAIKEDISSLHTEFKGAADKVNERLDSMFNWMLEKQRQNEARRDLSSERDGS